ncbi:hypothetical protein LIER_18268 [Lithospermum erythrorhizon]|uniref:Uncharacterized protein n=1 Tax=Lithospermum erythrorhizon TaxID=34254 RepID=A0AAV3QGI4_LITER
MSLMLDKVEGQKGFEVVSNAYLEERCNRRTKNELFDKSTQGKKDLHGNDKITWAELVEGEELQQFEQQDQPRVQRTWSTTVQVAQIGEGTWIVKAALKKFNGC